MTIPTTLGVFWRSKPALGGFDEVQAIVHVAAVEEGLQGVAAVGGVERQQVGRRRPCHGYHQVIGPEGDRDGM